MRVLLAISLALLGQAELEAQGPSKNPKVYEITGDQKPPEFKDIEAWINSEPLKLKEQKGKVVVIHFFAMNCINCIRNYPSYRGWEKTYAEKDLVLIGIHTPELESEKDLAKLREKIKEAGFTHPIAVDAKATMFRAFNNHWWPAVYVIDKRGVARCYWYGELKLYGVDGDKLMRERIDKLLQEK